MLINGIKDIDEGYSAFQKAVNVDEDYGYLWNDLLPIDQAVLQLLASDLDVDLYTEKARLWLGELLGVDEISVPKIQNAIDRLRDEQLIYNGGYRVWLFEDERFKTWVNIKLNKAKAVNRL